MSLCNCDTGLYDLGVNDCIINPSIIRKLVFVKYAGANGLPNGIDLNATFGDTEIDALINNVDNNLRWHFSPEMANVVTDRADPNTETIDNVDYVISQGNRTTTADFLTSASDLSSKLNSNRCTEFGIFIIDQDNGITGVVTRDGFLDPIRISKGSLWAKVVMATEANIFKVSTAFTWSKLMRDGDMRVLTSDSTGSNVLAKQGLINVDEIASDAVSTTTATISYSSVDGTAKGLPFTGLVFGDFVAYNTTADSAVTITAAPEGPDGTYLLTFAAQTTGDVVTVDATSAGYTFQQGSFIAL